MKRFITAASTILLLTLSSMALGHPTANVNDDGLALKGYDPVSYFKSSAPALGKANIQVKQDGITYLFQNEENKQAFLKEPHKYEPQFGGWCAYAVADSSSKVPVDPQTYLIQDGRLLLFYNGWLGDTKKTWTTDKKKDAKSYLKDADKNWPATKTKEP